MIYTQSSEMIIGESERGVRDKNGSVAVGKGRRDEDVSRRIDKGGNIKGHRTIVKGY